MHQEWEEGSETLTSIKSSLSLEIKKKEKNKERKDKTYCFYTRIMISARVNPNGLELIKLCQYNPLNKANMLDTIMAFCLPVKE